MLGGACSLLLSACGAVVQQNRIEYQFANDCQCHDMSSLVEPGGYAVTGCGVVAHYRCLSGHHLDPFDSEASECFLADSEDGARVPAGPPPEAVSAHPDRNLGVVVRGHADVSPGVQLIVLGAPLKEPHRVVLELHMRDRVTSGACSARMFRDGSPLPVLEASSIGDYDLRWIVDVAGFEAAQDSVRIAGDGCGISFELDDDGRRMLGVFAARFHEEQVKASAAPAAAPAPNG
jgi:hypothetical protein